MELLRFEAANGSVIGSKREDSYQKAVAAAMGNGCGQCGRDSVVAIAGAAGGAGHLGQAVGGVVGVGGDGAVGLDLHLQGRTPAEAWAERKKSTRRPEWFDAWEGRLTGWFFPP